MSEIFEGNAPHHPQGAIAQAWSVAEIMRHRRREHRNSFSYLLFGELGVRDPDFYKWSVSGGV
jgi:glycogen debranching enzyme